jgi:hypothetical protein
MQKSYKILFLILSLVILGSHKNIYFQEEDISEEMEVAETEVEPPFAKASADRSAGRPEDLEEEAEEPEEAAAPEEKEEPEELEVEEPEGLEEVVPPDVEIGEPSLVGILQKSPFFNLLQNVFGGFFPAIDIKGKIEKIKAGLKHQAEHIKKFGLLIPLIGRLKFEKYKEAIKVAGDLPTFVGRLYSESGQVKKIINLGPLVIKTFKIYLFEETKIPNIKCDVALFNKLGTLTQKKSDEGGTEFLYTLHKPILIPTGIKRRVPIKEVTLVVSGEKRLIKTEAIIFGSKDEAPSDIQLDLSKPPFMFHIKSKNIPITALSSVLTATPFKKLVITTLTLRVGIAPPVVKLYGETNLKDINLGIKGEDAIAKISATLGAEGFQFIIDMKNITIPFGKLKTAQIRIGT